MKLGRILLAGAALAMCGASAAQAGTKIIATPPISNGVPVVHTMFCDIVNLNTTTKDVTIEIMDYNGLTMVGPIGPLSLPPNGAFAINESTGTGAWCKWTVNGSTKKYRALAVYDNGSEYTVSIPGY